MEFKRLIIYVLLIFFLMQFIVYRLFKNYGNAPMFNVLLFPQHVSYDVNIKPNVSENKSIRIHFFNYLSGYFEKQPFAKCDKKCDMTTGEKTYMNSSVVLFLGPRIGATPPKKYNGQVWVFFGRESPYHYNAHFQKWNNLINWTMTYRRDSDIFTPSGLFENIDTNSTRNNYSTPQKESSNIVKIAWMVSNCHAPSGRRKYAALLNTSTNITIDIYGSCGSHKCPRSKELSCMKTVSDSYDFYLSFENSLCVDYITEKPFKIYLGFVNVIPITRGIGKQYSLYLPPGSFLNTNDYANIAKLQEDITKIGSDFKKFKAFFNWRLFYRVQDINYYSKYFCDLCSRLHDKDVKKKYTRIYEDIDTWLRGNEEDPICLKPKDI